jgi:energy-coupling factor transport system permease protein
LALAVLVIVTNAIASQRGDTILIRGFDFPVLGQIDVSLEAIVEGAILALRIGVVFAASAVFTACVDPDRVLRLLRPFTPRSALTSAVIVRMVPLAAADHAALREASVLRGPAAEPVGRAALARRLIAGSLDRAVDVAATLELRGYAHGAPRRVGRAKRSPSSVPFALAGVTIAGLVIAARLAGIADYESYPTIELDAGAATWAIAAALPLLAIAPFWFDEARRSVRRRAPRRRRELGGSVA